VLSFGYWCTDFLVIQRAMAADSMGAARRTPLIAAVPKMFLPFLVILPGLIAIALPTTAADDPSARPPGAPAPASAGKGIIPVKVDPQTGRPMSDSHGAPEYDYDLAIPNLLLHYFPTGMLGLGLTALLASFMSGMAGNITAFNTVWTFDIYQGPSATTSRSVLCHHVPISPL
jgi:SSS family solute:Na+ symporter